MNGLTDPPTSNAPATPSSASPAAAITPEIASCHDATMRARAPTPGLPVGEGGGEHLTGGQGQGHRGARVDHRDRLGWLTTDTARREQLLLHRAVARSATPPAPDTGHAYPAPVDLGERLPRFVQPAATGTRPRRRAAPAGRRRDPLEPPASASAAERARSAGGSFLRQPRGHTRQRNHTGADSRPDSRPARPDGVVAASAPQLHLARRAPSAACSSSSAKYRALRRGQHAARAQLGKFGEPRRLVDRVADHGVLEAVRGADVAGDRQARRDADADVETGDLCSASGSSRGPRPARRSGRRGGRAGAPKMASAASPTNLLTKPLCSVDGRRRRRGRTR